jgi:hypothetical protein
MNKTMTTDEAAAALGVKKNQVHILRRKYPAAFVIVEKGSGGGHPTHYDAERIAQFIAWRNARNNPFKP